MKETATVKFLSENRKITLDFTSDGEGLDMTMDVWPEFDPEKEESPDLCLLLCSTLVNALSADVEVKKEDENPKVYDGTD